MNNKIANITDVRKKMPELEKQTKKGCVTLLKNGKPVLGLINYNDLTAFIEWKEKQKKKNLIKTINEMADLLKKERAGEKWLQKKGLSKKEIENLSENDILDLLYKDK